MSSFIGMDIQAVRTVSQQLKTQAARIGETIQAIESQVTSAENNWKGRDSEQFANQWRAEYKPSMSQLQQALDQLGMTAGRQADNQEQVSAN